MADKHRSINTHFWDDNYIVQLDPIEKLLFLYLLSNTLTNIAGIYEITFRRIAFDTGIDSEMVKKILLRFEEDKKAAYIDGYVILVNFMKNQRLNANMKRGADQILSELPETVSKAFEAFQRLSNTCLKRKVKRKGKVKGKYECADADPSIPFQKILDDLNQKAGTSFKPTEKTRGLIKARFAQGFKENDFFTVHGKKIEDWLHDPKMCEYLRPETLYSNKFEGYLNRVQKQTAVSQVTITNIAAAKKVLEKIEGQEAANAE